MEAWQTSAKALLRFLCELLVIASVLQAASLGANFCLGKMADLDSWLLTNVGTDARRAEVRAVVESLEDLRWLSDHTALPRGPGFDAGVVMALRRVIGTHRAACARAVV